MRRTIVLTMVSGGMLVVWRLLPERVRTSGDRVVRRTRERRVLQGHGLDGLLRSHPAWRDGPPGLRPNARGHPASSGRLLPDPHRLYRIARDLRSGPAGGSKLARLTDFFQTLDIPTTAVFPCAGKG